MQPMVGRGAGWWMLPFALAFFLSGSGEAWAQFMGSPDGRGEALPVRDVPRPKVIPPPLDSLHAVPPPASGSAEDLGVERSHLLRNLLHGETEISMPASNAEAPDYVGVLRLDEAVAMALKTNFEVLAAQSKKTGTAWEVVAAYGQYAPQVKFTRASGIERSSPASINDSSGARVEDDRHHRGDRVLEIQQPIIDVAIISNILQRHINNDMADVQRIGVRERVAMETVQSYLKLIQAVLTIHYAESYKDSLDGLMARMAVRVDGGGASRADLERVRSRAISAETAIISARSELAATQVEFRRLTGISPLKIRVPARLLPSLPDVSAAALARAVASNPEYVASGLQADSTQMESYKAFSRVLPALSFELSRTTTYNAGGAAKGNPIDGGPWAYQHENLAMLVMTWQFNGGTDIAEGMGYGARAKEAQYKTMDVRRRIEENMANSYTALNAADKRIRATRSALRANTQVAQSFEEQYLASSRPLFDLLDAYERLYSSRVELVRLLISEAQAAYQVRRQMGELVGAVLGSEDVRP
ncbi:MAG: TolC family protein [Rhodospirillaceae bacterium]|nr:TolC family protein [Rhodospirillaceae bacterium]